MYKAEATDPVLAALDASQRSMGYATGFSFPWWQQGLDIQLLNRSGKIGATSLRTISCTEPSQNMNNKKIGRDAMWNGERAKALARDNLGGRKGMRTVEVNQNWTLANKHIRGWWARAVVISNDAKGSFDRIAHVVAILALRGLGIPWPAIMSMIITIQQMQHHIRMAFGESEQSCGPNPSGPPPQALIQGNGAAPAAWSAITAILVDCMKGEGYGYKAWAPISQRAMTLVCFGFVDDTNLILNNNDPGVTSEDLIDEAQLELSTWEGSSVLPEEPWHQKRAIGTWWKWALTENTSPKLSNRAPSFCTTKAGLKPLNVWRSRKLAKPWASGPARMA